MNEIVNKVLLSGYKSIPENHLRQPGFTHSACVPFTKNKERIQKFKEVGDSRYISQKELALKQLTFKNFTRRTASDKIFYDKAFNIVKNPKYEGCQRGLASMVSQVFDKKALGSGIKNENISNNELPEELHKPILRKSKKGTLQSAFIEKIWDT